MVHEHAQLGKGHAARPAQPRRAVFFLAHRAAGEHEHVVTTYMAPSVASSSAAGANSSLLRLLTVAS